MLSARSRLQLCSVILSMSRLEKKVEVVRQLLCEHADFTPFTAFKTLDSRCFNRICADDLHAFLTAHNSALAYEHCVFFVSLFDKDSDNELSYDEFLDAILPQDNNGLRQHTLSKESDVSAFNGLDLEIQYTLVKLIEWSTKGVTDLESEKIALVGSCSPIALQPDDGYAARAAFLESCFGEIDVERRGFLTPRQVDTFFDANHQSIYAEEIEAFFRRASTTSQRIDMLSKHDFIAALDFVHSSHNTYPTQQPQPHRIDAYSNPKQVRSPNNHLFGHNTSTSVTNNSNSGYCLYQTQTPLTPCQKQNQSSSLLRSQQKQGASASSRKLSFHSSTINRNETDKENSHYSSISGASANKFLRLDHANTTATTSTSTTSESRETKKQQQLRHLNVASENHYDLGKLRVEEEINRVQLIRELSNSSKRRRAGASSPIESKLKPNDRSTLHSQKSGNTSSTNNKNRYDPNPRINHSRKNSLGSISPSPSFKNLSNKITASPPIEQSYYVASFARTSVSPFKVATEIDRRDHVKHTAATGTMSRKQSRGRLSTKQGVLEFKQNIRGKLATSKLVRNSESPSQQSSFNTSSSLNLSNTIRKYPKIPVQQQQEQQVAQQRFPNSSLRMRSYFEITKPKTKRKPQPGLIGTANNSISNLPLRFAANTLLTGEEDDDARAIVNNCDQQQQEEDDDDDDINDRQSPKTSMKNKEVRRLDCNSAKEMPARNLRQNTAFQLRKYCMRGVMNSRRSEPLKIELSSRQDFNLFQLFELLDRSQRGSISAYDVHLFFASQSIPVSLTDITLFVRRLDRLDIDLIRFSTFAQALTPLPRESHQQAQFEQMPYASSSFNSSTGPQQQPAQVCGLKEFSPESVVSRDTMKAFSALLLELIASERRLEDLRQEIFKEKKWDYFYAYQVLDAKQKGAVTLAEMGDFITDSGEYHVGREDVQAILNVFNVENGDSLREDKFLAELQPKALP